jgi:transposase InsO family protein
MHQEITDVTGDPTGVSSLPGGRRAASTTQAIRGPVGEGGDEVSVARFIASQRTEHRVPHAKCCRWLGVSESWFYKWHDREPTPRQQRRAILDEAVRTSFEESGGNPGTYGSPRVLEDLIEAGWKVSKNTVAASMARQGLAGRSPKRKRRCLTRPDRAADPIPDLIGRDFSAERIDQRWCGDLTEIPTDEGKLYLATVLDLASRRLPGFALGEHHDSPLAKAALCMAAAVRGGDVDGVVFHSDKGGEYVGDLFARACASLGVTQSMGRVGSALDNAAAESFNSTLEHELLSRKHFETKDQARRETARFVDTYNHRRRHSSCEMLPPVAYEALLAARAAEAARSDRAA